MPWDIKLNSDMQGIVDDVLKADKPMVDALKKHLGEVVERARRLAPVKTGKFRDSIRFSVGLTALGEIRADILVDVPYAWYVNKGATVKALIFQPADAAAELVVRDTATRWGQ